MREFSLFELKPLVLLGSVHNLSNEVGMLARQPPLNDISLEFCNLLTMLTKVQYYYYSKPFSYNAPKSHKYRTITCDIVKINLNI